MLSHASLYWLHHALFAGFFLILLYYRYILEIHSWDLFPLNYFSCYCLIYAEVLFYVINILLLHGHHKDWLTEYYCLVIEPKFNIPFLLLTAFSLYISLSKYLLTWSPLNVSLKSAIHQSFSELILKTGWTASGSFSLTKTTLPPYIAFLNLNVCSFLLTFLCF